MVRNVNSENKKVIQIIPAYKSSDSLSYCFIIGQSSNLFRLILYMNCPCSSLSQILIFLFNFLKGIDFVLIAPKTIGFRILLLDELVIWNIRRQECIFVCLIGAFGDMSETGSELVLGVFARNEATVAGDLRAGIRGHDFFFGKKYYFMDKVSFIL